jgi:hypothetical protein
MYRLVVRGISSCLDFEVEAESEADDGLMVALVADVGGVGVRIPFWILRIQSLKRDWAARRRAWEVERCSSSDCRRCCSWESWGIGRVEMSTA